MSEILDPPVGAVAAALTAVGEALDRLAEVEPWTMSGVELTEAARELERLRSRAEGQALRMLHEIDVRGAAVELGAASTAAWLRWALHMHPGRAKREVATARALHDDPTGPLVPLATDGLQAGGLTATRRALQLGEISGEHATVVATTMAGLPVGVDTETLRRGEVVMVEHARVHDPRQLEILGRRLQHALDPAAGDRLADDEERQVAERELHVISKRGGGFRLRGEVDQELGAALLTALDSYAAPRPAADGTRDPRSPARRHADALADLVGLVLGTDLLPRQRAGRARLAVSVDLSSLRREVGAVGGMLDRGGALSAETVRRLACDAQVIPVVLGAVGEPLDVGRAMRTVPTGIRRALIARDGGCAFPGCGRPPEWTEAHHVKHWADGGETSLANTVLFCDHHHRVVHHQGWAVHIGDDGLPVMTPPPWIDPRQVPLSPRWPRSVDQLRRPRGSPHRQAQPDEGPKPESGRSRPGPLPVWRE